MTEPTEPQPEASPDAERNSANPVGGGVDESSEATPKPDTPAKPGVSANAQPQRSFLGKLWYDWVKPLGTVILVVTVVRSSLLDWNDVPSGSMRPTILEGDRIVVNKLAYGINAPFNGPKIDLPGLPAFNNPLDFLPGLHYGSPKRGDIVTFWNPTPAWRPAPNGQQADNPSSGIRMVKRVVGVPGDTVRVIDGKLQITDAQGRAVTVTYDEVTDKPYHAEPTTAVQRDASGRMRGRQMDLPVEFELETFADPDDPEADPQTHFVQFLQEDGGWTPSGHDYRTVPRDGTAMTLADPEGRKLDEYLMIGDNRDNSLDSRYYWDAYRQFGDPPGSGEPVVVTAEHITGKAMFIAVSFEGGSFLSPAWSRFFRGFDGEAEAMAE